MDSYSLYPTAKFLLQTLKILLSITSHDSDQGRAEHVSLLEGR